MSVNAAVINQQTLMQQFVTQQSTEQAASTTGDSSNPPSQVQLLSDINEAAYEMFLSFCAITNTKDGSHPLPEEMYPLADSITNFVNLCNEYDNAGYQPPLNEPDNNNSEINETYQLYTILTTPMIAVGGSSTLLSPYEVSENIMNPPSGTTSEEWEDTLASTYHPGDPDSNSALWNACEILNSLEGHHAPEPFTGTLSTAVSALQATWNSIENGPGTIDPSNPNNILPQLASEIVAVNTDLTDLSQPASASNPTGQGYLTANEQMLYDVLNAPLQGQFGATLASSATALVQNPGSQADLDTFANIVANDNYYVATVLNVCTSSNPQIYNYQS
ncbi:MAG: hypothetical protein KF898_09850 [Parachlamydiales bacterium]|nr:hypothetical protein [Verrucomicrobiota bacterium]MBX3719937.1 hypothetical protein [Candidatus Acheromyda pituitae]